MSDDMTDETSKGSTVTDIIHLSAAEMAAKLADGSLTSVELTQAHLDRIAAVDGDVHAFLHVNAEEALATAAQVDADRAAGKTLHPLAGVPVATLLGQRLGWQAPYALVAVIAAVAALAVWRWVPPQPAPRDATIASELSALTRPQVWLALLMGVVGFGGIFATFSYIAPTMTELSGFAAATVPLILVLYGLGMTAGAMLAGRVARIGLLRGILATLGAIAVLLLAFGPAAHRRPTALLAVFLLGALPSILVPMLQTRLMDVAHEGQSLAAALNHSTLNLANALGAWLGGLVLAHGMGYEWPSRVGALLAGGGMLVVLVSGVTGRRAAARDLALAA